MNESFTNNKINEKIETPPKPELPIEKFKGEIVENIKKNSNTIVVGATGSGKTTCIPEMLLDEVEFVDKKIAILQPRRVAATSVARYVAHKRGQDLGKDVGYQIRFDNNTESETRATFMTDGILLRKIQIDPDLDEYDVVMVDEAHERSLNIDLCLGLLKQIQARRREDGKKDLKIIVASATIEKEKFAEYFGEAPVVEVPGRMYPVEVIYENEPIEDYMEAAAVKVKQIIESGEEGDVLIFMSGEDEIRATMNKIREIPSISEEIDLMPLFGSMAPEDQDRIFAPNSRRKVIVATNIAETSITIDGVKFVVDSGYIKQKSLNIDIGIEELNVQSHAQSGCEQRKGRAGRTSSGKCYRLFTEAEFEQRPKFQTPEIVRTNLDHVILHMKSIGIDDVKNFDFIDKPKDEAVEQAILRLKILGALDDGEKLTKDGELMADLPLKPEISRMVIEAQKSGCVSNVCTIAAMMGDKPLFVRPKGKEYDADTAHRKFKENSEGSDFICLLNVWREWARTGFDTRNWPRDNYINWRQLLEFRDVRNQLMQALQNNNIPFDNSNDDPRAVEKCILSGLVKNLLISSSKFGYKRVFGGEDIIYSDEIFIHPGSVCTNSNREELMIGLDIVRTTKTFARKCQPVKAEWLFEEFPKMFTSSGGRRLEYNSFSGEVEDKEVYIFNPSNNVRVEKKYEVSDEVAKEVFLKALADGKVDLPNQYENNLMLRKIKELTFKSNGKVQIPNLKDWYASRIGDVKSRAELIEISDKLVLRREDFISDEQEGEIEKSYPKYFKIGDTTIYVAYEFKEGREESVLEEGKKDRLMASIDIPSGIIDEMQSSDIPQIGINGNTSIEFRTIINGDWKSIRASTFEELKLLQGTRRIEMDSERLMASSRSTYHSSSSSSRYSPFTPSYQEPEKPKLGSLGDLFDKTLKDESQDVNPSGKKIEEVVTAPKPKIEIVKETMTEEIREALFKELAKVPVFLDFSRKVPELGNRDRNREKLEKLKTKAGDLKKEYNIFVRELADSTDVERMKGKVIDIAKRTEKTLEDISRIIMSREDVVERFDKFMTDVERICKTQEIPLDRALVEKITPKMFELARKDGVINNLNSALETIIYEAV